MFDVACSPSIEFVSTSFFPTGDDKGGLLTGNLTIRGTTRPVTLNVTFNGHTVNPLTKQETLGFSADGHFSRSQFGLTTRGIPPSATTFTSRFKRSFLRRSDFF